MCMIKKTVILNLLRQYYWRNIFENQQKWGKYQYTANNIPPTQLFSDRTIHLSIMIKF